MQNLFLICPECYPEQAIRNEFGSEGLFLSALGSVFHIDNAKYIAGFMELIDKEQVSCIYIVNDTSCSFLQNAIDKKEIYSTETSRDLNELLILNKGRVINTTLKLAKVSIVNQARELLKIGKIRSKIKEGDLIIKGLIYFRNTKTFEAYHIRNVNENPRLSNFSDN